MKTLNLEELISNNSEIFKKELKSVIKPTFTGLDNQEKYSPIVSNFLAKSKRTPFRRQARVIAAATEFIKKRENKSLLLSQEMGTGKTQVAINISQDDKFKTNLVLCPPHLVEKWEAEILSVYKEEIHKDLRIIKVKTWKDLIPYAKRDLTKEKTKYYFIISREKAKLSYPKQVAVITKFKKIIKEELIDGQNVMNSSLIKTYCCPDCFSLIKEEDEDTTIPYNCRECNTVLRQVDKSVSKKMQNRVSIAEYISKQFKKKFDLLICDEIHEYKGSNTGQGNALSQLITKSKKIVGLTGTLLNGYASSVYYLLYRLNPSLVKKTLGFDYSQEKLFVSKFGAYENTYEAKDINTEGKVTKMGRKIGTAKEKPKISPHLLSVMLGMTIFLRLDEIKMEEGAGLPDYEEIVKLVDLDENLKGNYFNYLSDIASKVKKDKRFLGNLANDSLAVPDMPFQEHSAQDELFYEPEFTRADYGLTNKEKELISIVKDELECNRKCLVFVHFSNKGVGKDIEDILTNALPGKKVLFLPPKVKAEKREEWINNNPSDVLICNAELVKTGLDLLQFPTIIFYETSYNVFTLKQASRRSWRLGQKNNVKVFFMAYKDTPQHKALELIGAKVNAANSLEGRLSGEDDLSSLGEDDDNIQLALAKSIMTNEKVSSEIEMNSIKNFGNDRDWDSFESWYRPIQLEAINNTSIVEITPIKIEEPIDKTIEVTPIATIDIDSTTQIATPIFNSLLDYDGEITSTKAYQYITTKVKGKKVQTRVEIDLNNLKESEIGTNVQLSLF